MPTEDISIQPPYRVSFNFTGRCNMRCKFCYIPFDGDVPDLARCCAVVDRLASLGVEMITFGGGDPLRYRFLPELILAASDAGISQLHIDTNALGWARSDLLEKVAGLVNLVGLPLDGPNPYTHGATRSHSGNWSDVVSAAVYLNGKVPLKINTMVSKLNVDTIAELAALVALLRPTAWSLYEFWPIGPSAILNSDQFNIKPSEYRNALVQARSALSGLPITVEGGSADDRADAYFLVSHHGLAYTISHDKPWSYEQLGSIFDKGTLLRWGDAQRATANRLRAEQRVTLPTNRVNRQGF